MKKYIVAIGLALASVINASAFDWLTFVQDAGNSKQLTATIYPSYAPGLKLADGTKKEWGMGMALAYPVGTDHVLAGVRADWIQGQLFVPSLTITPNAQFQIKGHSFTVFGIGGMIVPLAGVGEENGEVGATVGAGVHTTVWQPTVNSSVQVWAGYERWTPVLDVNIYHLSVAYTIKF